jgi:post-segregation antitoxin (ccd killing protein)
MKTTVHIDDDLLKEARKEAFASNITISTVVEKALQEFFNKRKTAAPSREKVELITFKGRGLKPKVNLDDSAALLDLMESDECF